jgi:nitrile hydratase subunit beta
MSNTIHDMGGMHGFGPVAPEPNEPVFHAPWESKAYAMRVSMGTTRLWSIDGGRASLEMLPPTTYLTSYYERWFNGLERQLVKFGLVGEDELAAGRSLRPGRALDRKFTVEMARNFRGPMAPFERPSSAAAKFKPGDRVRTKEMSPTTHTRLPRYARDKEGVVEAIRGCHVYPDTAALDVHNENPQWLYTVVFTGKELWGRDSDPAITVSIEAFEPYLLPA